MNIATVSDDKPITFAVADVIPADSQLPTVNSVVAVTEQSGIRPEACSDYGSNYVAGVLTNPFATAVKLAHDQHRSLILSPDAVWLAVCQGLSIHIEENRAVREKHVLKKEYSSEFRLDASTADLPFRSPESPWPDWVNGVADKAYECVENTVKTIFRAEFSTTDQADFTARDLAFLSAVRDVLTIHDDPGVCGIPKITLRGTTNDWEQICDLLPTLEPFGFPEWVDELKKVCEEFVFASRGLIRRDFWSRIFVDDPAICGGDGRVSGWINAFFPYKSSLTFGVARNKALAGSGDKPRIDDFPSGLRGITFRDRRATDVHVDGGFLGVLQDPETLALEAVTGWAVHRLSSFETLIEQIKTSDLCTWTAWDSTVRCQLGGQPCHQLFYFYQAFRNLRFNTPQGKAICEFFTLPQEPLFDGKYFLKAPRYRNNRLSLIARLPNDRWIGVVEAEDMREFMTTGERGVSCFFAGDSKALASGECDFLGTNFEHLLACLFNAARSPTHPPLQPLTKFDPEASESLLKFCKAHNLSNGSVR